MTGDYVTTGLRNVIQPARGFPSRGEADVVGGGFRVSNYPSNAGYSRHISNQPPRQRSQEQLDPRQLTELARRRVVNRANAYAQYGPYVYHEILPHGGEAAPEPPGSPRSPASGAAGPQSPRSPPHVRTGRAPYPAGSPTHSTSAAPAPGRYPQPPQQAQGQWDAERAAAAADEGPPEAPDSPLRGVVRSSPAGQSVAAGASAAGAAAAAEAWLAANAGGGGGSPSTASEVSLRPGGRTPTTPAAAAMAAAGTAAEEGEVETPNATRASTNSPFHAGRPGVAAQPDEREYDDAHDTGGDGGGPSGGYGGGAQRAQLDVERASVGYRPGDSLQGPLPGGASPRLSRSSYGAMTPPGAAPLGRSMHASHGRTHAQPPHYPPVGPRPSSAAPAVGSATAPPAMPGAYPGVIRDAGRSRTQAFGYGSERWEAGAGAAEAEMDAWQDDDSLVQWESAAAIEGHPAYLSYSNLMAKGEFATVPVPAFPPGPQGGPAWRSFIMRNRPPPRRPAGSAPASASASASFTPSASQRRSGTWGRSGIGSRSEVPSPASPRATPPPAATAAGAAAATAVLEPGLRSSAPSLGRLSGSTTRRTPGQLTGSARAELQTRSDLWSARASLAADARTLRSAARLLRSENRRLGGEAAALASSMEGLAEGSLSPEFVRLHAEAVARRLEFAEEVAPVLAGGLGAMNSMREILPPGPTVEVAEAAAAAANAAAVVAAVAQAAAASRPLAATAHPHLPSATLPPRPSTAPASSGGADASAASYGYSTGKHTDVYGAQVAATAPAAAEAAQEYDFGDGGADGVRFRYVPPDELRRRRDAAAEAQLRRRLGAALSRSYDQVMERLLPSGTDADAMLQMVQLAKQRQQASDTQPRAGAEGARSQQEQHTPPQQGAGTDEGPQGEPEAARDQAEQQAEAHSPAPVAAPTPVNRRVTFAEGTRGGDGAVGGRDGGDWQRQQQQTAAGSDGGASGSHSFSFRPPVSAVEQERQRQLLRLQQQGQSAAGTAYAGPYVGDSVAAAALAVAGAAGSLARHAALARTHGANMAAGAGAGAGAEPTGSDGEAEAEADGNEDVGGEDGEGYGESRAELARRRSLQRVLWLLESRAAGVALHPKPPAPPPPQPFFELPTEPEDAEPEPPLTPRTAASRAAAAAAAAAAAGARPPFIGAAAILAGTGGRKMDREALHPDPAASAVDQFLAPPESSLLALFYMSCRRPVPHPDDVMAAALTEPDAEADGGGDPGPVESGDAEGDADRTDPRDGPGEGGDMRGAHAAGQAGEYAEQEDGHLGVERRTAVHGRGGGDDGDGGGDGEPQGFPEFPYRVAAASALSGLPPAGDLFMHRGSVGRAPYGRTFEHVAAWGVRDSLLLLERQALEMRLAGRARVPAAYLKADQELAAPLNLGDPDLEDRADELREEQREEEYEERVAEAAEGQPDPEDDE